MVEATPADGHLRQRREALAAADWEGARSWFERARESEETAEVLDGLSEAAHFHTSSSVPRPCWAMRT